ncbi:MAG: cytochrome P450 [Microscillaceae bacterium]|nr:cytochrome P450 [Microscillaceae bacterium]
MKNPIVLVALSELQESVPLGVDIQGLSLVVLKQADQISVFEGRCPHQGTLLSEGWVADGKLVCRTHQWKFDCLTGEKVKDAKVCLKKFTSQMDQGKILVDQDELFAYKKQSLHISGDSHKSETQALLHPSKLPGPKGLPVLGNLLQINNNTIHQQVEAWSKTYGNLFKIYLGGRLFIISADPEFNLYLLKIRPHSVSRSNRLHHIMKDFGIVGVFNAEGEQWRRQRQFVMQGLAQKHLRQFFPTIASVTDRLRKRWQKSAQKGEVIDIQNDLMRYTVDVTTSLAFGYDMNTLEKEKDVIQDHLEKIFPTMNRRLYMPFAYWKYFKFPSDKKTDKALEEIRKYGEGIIRETRLKIEQNPELEENPSNFLEALLVAKDEDGSKFTDDEIYSNVFTMLLAGEDTTANSIAWMAYYLTEYPEIARKIREEVDQVLGKDLVLEDFNLGKDLSYIDAFALETLRFKPVAPINGTLLLEDIPYKGYLFPKGTTILVASRPGSQLESHYPDSLSFKPERWLDPEFRKQDRFNIPFGSGPRLCPGRSLALLEIKVAVAMMVKNFDLERIPQKEEVKEHLAFTMMPRNLSIKLRERKAMEVLNPPSHAD